MASSIDNLNRSLRLSINYHYFNAHPVKAIKQLIGQNAVLVSYKTNSIVSWDGNIIVDIVYRSIPIDQFSIYYIKQSDIKHLMPNSEKYITVINGCNVKLNNPKLSQFKEYLPVRIKASMINETDEYENYYTQTINNDSNNKTVNMELKNNSTAPINYFATTVTNPMNSLITPLNILTLTTSSNNGNNGNNDLVSESTSFTVSMPEKLYPDSFKPTKELYTLDDTIKYYKQTVLSSLPVLSSIQEIQVLDKSVKSVSDLFSSSVPPSASSVAFILSLDQLRGVRMLYGFLLVQPRRIPDLILYYPTNTYVISEQEILSVIRFIEMDIINYNNFMYIKC